MNMSVDSSEDNGAEPSSKRQAITIDGPALFKKPPELKRLGGSQSDDWNSQIANQTINTLRIAKTEEGNASAETKADSKREAVPICRNGEWPMPDARWPVPRGAKGQSERLEARSLYANGDCREAGDFSACSEYEKACKGFGLIGHSAG